MSVKASINLQKKVQKQATRFEQGKTSRQVNRKPASQSQVEAEHASKGTTLEPFTVLFNCPQSKGLTGKCFRCGQMSHYQADCPHMDCI